MKGQQSQQRQKCNGTTSRQTRCQKPAGTDGFCHLHISQRIQVEHEESKIREDPAQLAERLKLLMLLFSFYFINHFAILSAEFD